MPRNLSCHPRQQSATLQGITATSANSLCKQKPSSGFQRLYLSLCLTVRGVAQQDNVWCEAVASCGVQRTVCVCPYMHRESRCTASAPVEQAQLSVDLYLSLRHGMESCEAVDCIRASGSCTQCEAQGSAVLVFPARPQTPAGLKACYHLRRRWGS